MSKRVIMMDDALWGFPIGGVLLGAYDSASEDFLVYEVPVKYFQTPLFEEKIYLKKMAETAIKILNNLNATEDCTIKICQGYVNCRIPLELRKKGFLKIEIGQIGEPLQSWLEKQASKYVLNLGYGEYYDPKELSQNEIRKAFWKVVRWVEDNQRYDIVKSGWKFWKNRIKSVV